MPLSQQVIMKVYSTESPELWEVRDALMWSVLPLVSKL